MAENNADKPKIIVDNDWKNQAQAEKERLAAEADAGKAAGPTGEQGERIPPASFVTLVSFIMTQALMSLGGYEDPQTKRRYVDLEAAKHYIDTLTVLEEKTKGNLTDDEKKLLDRALYETRMHYVQIAQRVSQM
jgi:hypothetical protein